MAAGKAQQGKVPASRGVVCVQAGETLQASNAIAFSVREYGHPMTQSPSHQRAGVAGAVGVAGAAGAGGAVRRMAARLITLVGSRTSAAMRMSFMRILGGDGRALPMRLKAEIVREIKRLEVVIEMIVAVEAERDVILTSAALTYVNASKIKMLAKLKAIGPEFATTLVGEVFYREFANRRKLGSYVGLGPSPFCSGSLDRDQGISKAGNPTARSMMIELAWTWLRYRPGSALSIWFRNVSATSRGGRAASPS